MRSRSESYLKPDEKKIEKTQQLFFKPKNGEPYSITQTTTVTINLDNKKTDGCLDYLKSCFKK